jgi:hypothetical protein
MPPSLVGRAVFGLVSQTLIEAKGFHAHDGTAISLARLAGIKTGLITKRVSETVGLRARDLKLNYVYQGIQDKLTAFEEILRQGGQRGSIRWGRHHRFAGNAELRVGKLRWPMPELKSKRTRTT